MTMNPNTSATRLRSETRAANAAVRKTASAKAGSGRTGTFASATGKTGTPAGSAVAAAGKAGKRLVGPATLFSAGFILAVSLIAKVFYK